MPSSSRTIQSAVGNFPAANRNPDQQVIIDLLSGIELADGGPANALPPAMKTGQVDFRLTNAILNFQLEMVGRGRMPRLFADGRVDPRGTTLRLMNEHFGRGRGGGGLVIPIDPKPTPKPGPGPTPKGAGFLQGLAGKMTPRPTNLRMNPGQSVSVGALEFQLAAADMTVSDTRPGFGAPVKLKMLGGGLSLGPIPFGVEIGPSSLPSLGSAIHAGPRAASSVIDIEELLGTCLIVGVSSNAGSPVGGSASAIMFSIGSQRTLKDLPMDLLNSVGPNVAINFLTDAFNTCRAYASSLGLFVGLSVGVNLLEGRVFGDVPNIRPDPDADQGRFRESRLFDLG